MEGRKSLTVYEGLGFLMENDFINTKNTSFEIVAEVETQGAGTSGVISICALGATLAAPSADAGASALGRKRPHCKATTTPTVATTPTTPSTAIAMSGAGMPLDARRG